MIYQKLVSSLAALALLAGGSSRAFSQEMDLNFYAPPQAGNTSVLVAQTFQPPRGNPPPDSSGGGVRGSTRQTPNFIPLIPRDSQTNILWGQTLSATPTFFLYVPAGVNNSIKFYLVNEQEGELLYEQVVIPPANGGVVSVVLPNQAGKTLQEGKLYNWYFELQIDPEQLNANPIISGFIQRVVANQELKSKLQAATTDSDRSSIYAANGIWYDLMATAAALRATSPSNWEAMLNSVGLGAIVQAPLITPSSNTINSNSNLMENPTTSN